MTTCVCGESKVYYSLKGNNTGCYCSSCNKWQKWVSKKEKAVLINRNITIYTEGAYQKNKNTFKEEEPKNEVKIPCGACGHSEHIYALKGDKVGRYCKQCLKWQTWIKKTDAKQLHSKGHKIYEYNSIRPTELAVTTPKVETREERTTDYVNGIPEEFQQDYKKVDYLDIEYDENPTFEESEQELKSSFEEELDEEGLTAQERATFEEYEREEGLINAVECTTCNSGVLELQGDKEKMYSLEVDTTEKLMILKNNRFLKIESYTDINFCPTCGRRL